GGKLEGGGGKVAVSGGEGHVAPVSAEADDVGSPVPANFPQFPRIGVVAAPTAGLDTEGGKLERGGCKVAVSRGQGHVHTGRAEADNVGPVVALNARHLARVGVLAAPTASVDTDGGKLEPGRRQGPASLAH